MSPVSAEADFIQYAKCVQSMIMSNGNDVHLLSICGCALQTHSVIFVKWLDCDTHSLVFDKTEKRITETLSEEI